MTRIKRSRRPAITAPSGDPIALPGLVLDPIRPPSDRNTWARWRGVLLGAPRNLWDRTIFHKVALIPLLAWVGMGADGLSSSAYGPEEAFKTLGEHRYLVPFLVLAVVGTIAIISLAYTRIIEHFPSGGGGYVVASKLLSPGAGLASGCALVVDYVLTITVSVAAGGDALFSLVGPEWRAAKLPVEVAGIAVLSLLNLRGIRESVISVAPVFFAFVATHLVLLVVSLGLHNGDFARVTWETADGTASGMQTLGLAGLAFILVRAYSMGAGTFTGIEAISNGVGALREPRVKSGKRTMAYMAISLSLVAAGLLVSYLYAGIHPVSGLTLNAVLARDAFDRSLPAVPWLGSGLYWLTILSEAGLLFIAAQTGFIDGPRVMANMAQDHWLPRRFSLLSHRLTMQNGVLLFGAGALAALWYAGGDTTTLVVMYSINVFLTFSLSLLSMLMLELRSTDRHRGRRRDIALHGTGFVLCVGILGLMIFEKFMLGGWVTLVVTGALAAGCLWTHRYYHGVADRMRRLDEQLMALPIKHRPTTRPLDPTQPTAILLVERYSGIGVHSVFSVLRTFPKTFKNIVFVSVGIVDSGSFKGADSLDELRQHVKEDLDRYVTLARKLGLPASSEMAFGTDVVSLSAEVCGKLAEQFRTIVVFGAKLVFQGERWYHPIMHNETARAIQSRLQWSGVAMTILPIRVFSNGRT